ncbi:ComEC/Rec2 family competence protein [Pollutibacter soli]|uniref:ComEC/Rec2 family competence protein n=1 Tax=Pollutibacter soli TaxID=3034157 RepID=UPI003013D13E
MKKKYSAPWNDSPFLRILPPFIAGIVFHTYLNLSSIILFTATFIFVIPLILFIYAPSWFSWKYRFIQGISVQILIFLLGPLMISLQFRNKPQGLYGTKNPETTYRYTLLEPPVKKSSFYKSIVGVELREGKHWQEAGIAVVYFSMSFSFDAILYGDAFIGKVSPIKITSAKNPGAFDYRKYMADNGVDYQVFLSPDKVFETKLNRGNRFYHFIFGIRDHLLSVLKTNISDSISCGLAEALLTGYRNDVDSELIQAYVNSGVVHVIAISGLHLGLIYLLLSWFSGILLRGRSKFYVQPLLVILALWIFTFVSGASASVVRSAVMFSLFALGNMLSRRSNPFNTLAASAFLLLAFKPLWIFDVGFQLSYTAVAGILLLHRKLCNAIPFTNPAAIKLWEATCLTLAAQVLTTPLLLLYFHRFPLLFLFTNLIAVPLSSIILIVELVLCSVSFFSPLASLIGELAGWLIRMMNKYVITMDQIPNSNLENVFISPIQTFLLYALILSAIFIRKENRSISAFAILFIIAAFSTERLRFTIKSGNQSLIIIPYTNKISTIGFIEKRNALLLSDSFSNKSKQNWILPLMYSYRLREPVLQKRPEAGASLISTSAHCVFQLSGRIIKPQIPYSNPKPDVILLSNNCNVNFGWLATIGKDIPIVADASNSLWKIQKWKKDAERLNLRFHSVPDQGAFLLYRD